MLGDSSASACPVLGGWGRIFLTPPSFDSSCLSRLNSLFKRDLFYVYGCLPTCLHVCCVSAGAQGNQRWASDSGAVQWDDALNTVKIYPSYYFNKTLIG